MTGVGVFAQGIEEYRRKAEAEFAAYRSMMDRDYSDYLARINAEFAEYMRRAWPEYSALPAIPVPSQPEPPSLPEIPDSGAMELPEPPEPHPVPVSEPSGDHADRGLFVFVYYGVECRVHLDESCRFVLADCSESTVADMWRNLSSGKYNMVVQECLGYREKLSLCDWAYFLFTGSLSEKFFTPQYRNEAVLFQMFILTQSGYKVRIARRGNALVLLMPSSDTVYGMSYIEMDGMKYYITGRPEGSSAFNVFDHCFPGERGISLRMDMEPAIAYRPSRPVTLSSVSYPDVTVTLCTNEYLMDFYDDYPYCRWNLYAEASFSREAGSVLFPVLETAVSGLSAPAAVDVLLDFVQTAFRYRTDQEQFGYERPLFPDEMLYYPYSDCEDRSAMFAALVDAIVGLDVVLLDYPEHIAAAVRFPQESIVASSDGGYSLCDGQTCRPADVLDIDGAKWVICDPTYIGARAGMCMPQFRKTVPDIVECNFRH